MATMDTLSDSGKAMVQKDSYQQSGAGTVCYDICPCCGRWRWISSKKEPQDKIVVVADRAYSPQNCDVCTLISTRHPEIFAWVVSVVLEQIRVGGK